MKHGLKTKFLPLVGAKVLVGIAVLASTGCQNPANRESNPIKKYNGLSFDVPASQIQPQENDGLQTVCGVPYAMSITDPNGKDAGRSLHFLVNESKTFSIHVSSIYTFKFSLAGAPTGVDLKKVSDTDYNLSWTPTDHQGNLAQDVKLVITVPKDQCVQGAVFETVSMNVNVNSLQPVVSVKGIDSAKIYQAKDVVAFTVNVVDPTLAPGDQPQALQVKSYDKNPTGENVLLNSDGVVQCGSPQPTGSAQSFQYACSLDIAKLIATNPNRRVGVTVLEIYVQSAAGESSVHLEKEVLISLPTPTVAPAASNQKSKTGANS